VIVAAAVRAANNHNDELTVAKDALVANGRLQERAVLVDPAFEVEGLQGWHGVCPEGDQRMVRKCWGVLLWRL
jgi:hypothetical protein